MRKALLNKSIAASAAVVLTLLFALYFALPCNSYAADGSSPLKERYAWFSYSYNECNGKAHTDENLPYSYNYSTTYPEHYLTYMLLCDTDHVIRVNGEGVTNDKVTFTSMDPTVLEVDSAGNVTLHKTGTAVIRATVAADEEYEECTIYLDVNADRHPGYDETVNVRFEGDPESMGLADMDTGEGPRKLIVPLRPGASVKYSSENPSVAYVDRNGTVTPLSAGEADIVFDIDDGGGKYKACRFFKSVKVTGASVLQRPQEITGESGPFTIDWHDGLQLDLQAKTDIQYQVISGSFASVDQTGFVSFSSEGTAIIKATAVETDDYLSDEITILITARDYATEEEARKADEAARRAEEDKLVAQALSLGKPSLKVKAKKGKKIKITWSRVANADGYIVYVKYPGAKKYAEATTRNAGVKSVTHKGLSKRKIYKYKIRAYKKVGDQIYYSPFSKVKKARAR